MNAKASWSRDQGTIGGRTWAVSQSDLTAGDSHREAVGVSKVVVVGRAAAAGGPQEPSNVNVDEAGPAAGAPSAKGHEAGAAAVPADAAPKGDGPTSWSWKAPSGSSDIIRNLRSPQYFHAMEQ